MSSSNSNATFRRDQSRLRVAEPVNGTDWFDVTAVSVRTARIRARSLAEAQRIADTMFGSTANTVTVEAGAVRDDDEEIRAAALEIAAEKHAARDVLP